MLSIVSLSLACVGPDDSGDSGSTTGPYWTPSVDAATTGYLSGVWGSSAQDVFVVGGSAEDQGEVHHYDGSGWSEMSLPSEAGLLIWTYGFSSQDVFAVGQNGTMVHYDGTEWSLIDTNTTHELWGVFGFSPDDLWVVGGTPDDGSDCGDPDAVAEEKYCIWHYDGESVSPVDLSTSENDRRAESIFKVWGVDGRLVSVGQRGLLLEYIDGSWMQQSAGANANDDFVSCDGTSADNIVCVGGRSNARIVTSDGSEWSTVSPSGIGGLYAVAMVGSDQAIVGGNNGFVGSHIPGSESVELEDFIGNGLVHAMWADPDGKVYTVGGRYPDTGFLFQRDIDEEAIP